MTDLQKQDPRDIDSSREVDLNDPVIKILRRYLDDVDVYRSDGAFAVGFTGSDALLAAYDAILADRAEHERKMQSIPHINGTDCPACGHPTLILGNGGYITCSLEGCPNPDYQEALELKLFEHERKARIDEQLRTRLKRYDDGTSAIVFRQSEGLEIEQDLRVAYLNQLNGDNKDE